MSASTRLDVPLLYCRDKIGGAGSVLYYSLLFLPLAPRSTLTALYALRRELDEAADEHADADVARLKFAWWQQELADMFRGQARHPVTRLLAPAAQRRTLSPDVFDELFRVAEARLPAQRVTRFDELLEHARRASDPMVALSTLLLGEEPVTSGSLGSAVELAEWLCGLGLHARRDRLPLPLADMSQFEVQETHVLHGKENEAFYRLMAFEIGRADSLLRESLRDVVPGGGQALLALRVRAQIALATLAAVRRKGYRVLLRRPTLAPLHMLWIAWRTKRTTGPSEGPA